jgi:hypothetical protein
VLREYNVSVRVFVILFEVALVGVRVRVGLPVVAVFVLVLDVLVIVQDVRVCMRHISVRVLVNVLRGHPLLRSWPYLFGGVSQLYRIVRASLIPTLHASHGLLASVSCRAN